MDFQKNCSYLSQKNSFGVLDDGFSKKLQVLVFISITGAIKNRKKHNVIN